MEPVRDLAFAWAWVAVFAFVGLVALLLRRRRNIDDEQEERGRREQQAEIRKKFAAGTHNEIGQSICRIDGCRNIAEFSGLRASRDDRTFAGWIRTLVGAPLRWRIVRNPTDPNAYCWSCHPVCRSEFGAFLVQKEQKRLERVRDDEVEISRFERIGLDERVNIRVAEHEQRVRPDQQPHSAKVHVLARG